MGPVGGHTQAPRPQVHRYTDDLPLKGWQREIDQVVFRGNILMDEVVFFHRASRTALFADLIGNFSPEFLPDKPVWRG